jgi:hypothetical protein
MPITTLDMPSISEYGACWGLGLARLGVRSQRTSSRTERRVIEPLQGLSPCVSQ